MMKQLVTTFLLFAFIASHALADEVKHPCPIDADIWVLAGQSNMQGAGKLREQFPRNPSIMMFNMDNTWQVAQHPLHRMYESAASVHRNINKKSPEEWEKLREKSMQKPIGGVCPGLFFGEHLFANGIKNIGLIPSAHGGTSMNQWDPEKKELGDESLYGAMINRIEMTGGNLKGLLWYQGESDAGDPEAYENKMLRFIDAIRKDTEQPDLPIIFVQINRFYLIKTTEDHKHGWEQVKESQRRIMSLRNKVYMVSAVDLTLDDLIHISYEGQKRLGQRMAEVALTNVYKQKGHANPIDVESIEYRKEEKTVKVRFSGVSGKLRAPGRIGDFKITSTNPEVHNYSVAYRADLDPEDPSAVLVRVQMPLTDSEYISYGLGMTAYCNLTDEADMAVPAFGPLSVVKPVSLNGKTHDAVISVEQKADYALKWWIPRHEQILQHNKEGEVDLIFLGNSITHSWENSGKEVWEKYYTPRNAVNMGFSGDRTQHVLWRIDHGELDDINPRVAVLMIGTNNSGINNPQEITDGIEEICLKIRGKLPDTKILLLGIFPRGEVSDKNREINEAANALIPKLADGKMIHFLNINEHFLKKDGTLGNYFLPDQVHLSKTGYKTWAKAMEPVIAQLLGE
jgi:lysophospholipase L1-like esterase